MTASTTASSAYPTSRLLMELGIQPRLLGFRQLCAAIDRYSQGDIQSMAKELYPYVAALTGCSPTAVEHAIRYTITDAWNHKDPEVWERYFPNTTKVPSNKEFIAILAVCR